MRTMRICDNDLTVLRIIDVIKGHAPAKKTRCRSRKSDSFVFVTSGYALYSFGNKVVKAEKNNIIYLSHNSQYEIDVPETNYTFIHVDFMLEQLPDCVLENEVFTHENLAFLDNIFIKLYKLWSAGNFADKITCRALLYQIYAEVVSTDLLSYVPMNKREYVYTVTELMRKEYCNPDFSLNQLMEESRVSPVYFRRIFQQIYHTTPIKYLGMLRLNKAKELLATTSLPIAEIAELCGFQSAYYFSKKFRMSTQMTPSEYREISK